MKDPKENACLIVSLLKDGISHQQTLCQKAQQDFRMSSKDFWQSFAWLKTSNHVRLQANSKSSYALTPSGSKLQPHEILQTA